MPSSQHLPRGSGWQPRSHPWFTLFPNPQHPNHQQVPFALLTKYILNWTIFQHFTCHHLGGSHHCTHLQCCFQACIPRNPFFTQQPEWSFINLKQNSSFPAAENPPMASLCIWNKTQNAKTMHDLAPLYFSNLTLYHPPLLFRSRHSALKFVPEHADLVFPTQPLHLLFLLSKTFLPWLTTQLLSSLGRVSTQKSGKPLTCLLFSLFIFYIYLFSCLLLFLRNLFNLFIAMCLVLCKVPAI